MWTRSRMPFYNAIDRKLNWSAIIVETHFSRTAELFLSHGMRVWQYILTHQGEHSVTELLGVPEKVHKCSTLFSTVRFHKFPSASHVLFLFDDRWEFATRTTSFTCLTRSVASQPIFLLERYWSQMFTFTKKNHYQTIPRDNQREWCWFLSFSGRLGQGYDDRCLDQLCSV